MRAATRERMISNMALVLVISICFLVPKAVAQSDKYSKMAPVDHHWHVNELMVPLARKKLLSFLVNRGSHDRLDDL
jgi:hypothetical protein